MPDFVARVRDPGVVRQVVQEFERAVIFRLGRLRSGGARGPGVFFVLPCIDTYCKVDLRTVSFDVPPQEVSPTPRPASRAARRPSPGRAPGGARRAGARLEACRERV